jgi:uncharacterized protein (TIGR02996 family)
VTDEPAFTRALSADPTDATTRLVYADWLDERARHVDAAVERVLARPAEDALRLAAADALEAEAQPLWDTIRHNDCPTCGWAYRKKLGCHPGNCSYRPTQGTEDYAQLERRKRILALRERAELIRVQVELAVVRPRQCDCISDKVKGPNCQRRTQLEGRELQLLTQAAKQRWDWTGGDHLTFWVKGEPQFPRAGVIAFLGLQLVGTFVRGFIERVTGPAALWLEHNSSILAAHPVQRVCFTTWPDFADNKYRQRGIPAIVLQGLRVLWPKIEFELPPAVGINLDAPGGGFHVNPAGASAGFSVHPPANPPA